MFHFLVEHLRSVTELDGYHVGFVVGYLFARG
jgi:hypothetical protein